MMTPSSLAKKITSFFFWLLETEIAINAKYHLQKKIGKGLFLISWSPRTCFDPYRYDDANFDQYMEMLQGGHYSCVLRDGSLLQVTYWLRGGHIIRHRLCLYPCPIDLEDEIDLHSLESILYTIGPEEYRERGRLISAIRFDFDPEQAYDLHPASHLHFNSECCRIPVKSGVDFGTFIKFIFRNYYPELWMKYDSIRNLSSTNSPVTITKEEVKTAHIHWLTS